MNKKIKIAAFILLVLLGGFFFIFGEIDDSPGLQLIGVVLAATGIFRIVKIIKKNRK